MVLVWFACVYDCCRLGVLRLVLANGFCGLIVLVVTILIVLLCSVYGCMYGCWACCLVLVVCVAFVVLLFGFKFCCSCCGFAF